MPPSVHDAVEVRSAEPLLGVGFARRKLADYLLFTKARLALLVLSTAIVSFWLAAGAEPDLGKLALFGVGTLFVIGGANALNQIAERNQDKLMARTARRPIPAGRMELGEAWTAAVAMTAGGLAVLGLATNALTALLGAAAAAIYVLGYTPLKRLTEWSTLVGAVSGAIPPLMGWTAVRAEIGLPAVALFGILFVWQFPHTWAIASLYREDYRRAGYRVLPLVDPTGRRVKRQTAVGAVALVAASLAPFALGMTGPRYALGVVVLDVFLAVFAFRFAFDGSRRSRRRAGELMAASLAYVPLLMALLVLDRRSL